MKKKKVFILLPDGIGLRNFAYTNFKDLAESAHFEIVFWNITSFSLTEMGLNEIRIENVKTHPYTDTLKKARKHIELNLSKKKEQDEVYDSYRFSSPNTTIKAVVKNLITNLAVFFYSNERGLEKVRTTIKRKERTTNYYKACLATLKKENPDLVFCTNQRIVTAVTPLLATEDLGIPTATFIFSWDNLPKATMVVETDYYFVWSHFMKNELQKYYPYIKETQIKVTGTPQFESHFDKTILKSKTEFFKTHGLDLKKKYICFSGDDVTTSPDDPAYLHDVANTIKKLNKNGNSLGIVFRRSPVDVSGRYQHVISKYKDIIVEIAPKWTSMNESWNAIFPTKDDNILLSNTIAHTEGVINLGSSMVFDYAGFRKPCIYLNYNQPVSSRPNWKIHNCYKYVHFRSMPDGAVVWLNNKNEIAQKIMSILEDNLSTVKNAQKWFDVICEAPQNKASENIINAMDEIVLIKQIKRT